MSISDCQTCRDFLGDAEISIKRHLEAIGELTLALRNSDNQAEISDLEDSVDTCSLARENSVARYEAHLDGHESRTMTSGSGSTKGA
jgi:hypothetical protein